MTDLSGLVLSRRPGESIRLRLSNGEWILIQNIGQKGNQTKLLIDAPKDVLIDREEVEEKKKPVTV